MNEIKIIERKMILVWMESKWQLELGPRSIAIAIASNDLNSIPAPVKDNVN